MRAEYIRDEPVLKLRENRRSLYYIVSLIVGLDSAIIVILREISVSWIERFLDRALPVPYTPCYSLALFWPDWRDLTFVTAPRLQQLGMSQCQ